MKTTTKLLITLGIISSLALITTGCKKKTAGDHLDEGIQQTKEATHDAKDKTMDAAEDMQEYLNIRN